MSRKRVYASWPKGHISLGADLRTPYGGRIIVGEHVEIHDGVKILTYGGRIMIGDNVSINPYSVIYGHGNLKIGNDVRIAAHTVIIPSNHNYLETEKSIFSQGETSLGVVIENDVWIGTGVRILDGLTISHGCVIGAGSVVNKSTEPFGVYAGVPARLIKSRKALF